MASKVVGVIITAPTPKRKQRPKVKQSFFKNFFTTHLLFFFVCKNKREEKKINSAASR